MAGQTFNVRATDAIGTFNLTNGITTFATGTTVTTLNLYNSTATTGSASNVTTDVNLNNGSTLTLNNNLTLSGALNIASSTVNAQGRNISAPGAIYLGVNGAPGILQNSGRITTANWQQAGAASTATVRSGQDSFGRLTLSTGTILNVRNAPGLGTGLTVTDTDVAAITVNDTSKLRLNLDGNIQGWLLRWMNPGAGDHVADLNALITAGKIDFTVTNGGMSIVANNADGFTYIYQPVPEPATTLLIAAGGLASAWVIRRRRLASV